MVRRKVVIDIINECLVVVVEVKDLEVLLFEGRTMTDFSVAMVLRGWK